MNSLEAARQRAEQLHVDAVAARHNPRNPYEFIRAQVEKLLIEVERVPKGDIRLYGGRALYDPDALLILHEETGDAFLNAFLIAHELGHIDLGGQSEPMAIMDTDPLRAAEAVPISVERVVDYSRRQRREVQMDLFAREFLLPRPWLRKLHISEGMTASEIATFTSAPFAVVAQQLLDALLLPRVENVAKEATPERPLAPDQAPAASHEGSPYLLEAGPGTGKTQTLVGRIEHLLSRGVDPEKILILTFSNKAASELTERIGNKYPEAAAKIWAGTFHGFGLDIIRRFHDRLKLPVSPRLLDRSDAIELLEREYPKLNLTHFKNLWDPSDTLGKILSAISRANDEVVDAAEYRSCAEKMYAAATTAEEREVAEKCREVATAFAAYERLKTESGCVDFGDLVALPVRLCESHPDIKQHLAATYEHILVDEYQDVNRASVRLLKAIAGDGKNLWVVGDAKQSIYRFRGASAYNMGRFGNEDFPGAKRGRLTINYRSHEEVISAYLKFAEEITSVRGANIGLTANRGACGRLPEYRAVVRSDDEVAAVAEAIEELRKEGYSYRDQAILSSGNDRLGRFAEGLERLGIPVLYLGSLFERDEIKELLSVLLLVVDRRAMGLVRVAAADRWAVPLGDVASLLWHLKDQDCLPLAWVEALDGVPGISAEGREGLRRIAALAAGFSINANPWDVLASVLLDRSRVAAEFAGSSAVNARTQAIAIWQLMSFIRTQPPGKGLPIMRLLERIRRMVLHGDEKDLRQLPTSAQGIDAVRLMTMHGSKGLEFGVVHIPGMVNGSLPRSPRSDLARSIIPPDGLIEGVSGKSLDVLLTSISEEHECLFFVALSRARTDCCFTLLLRNRTAAIGLDPLSWIVWGVASPQATSLRKRGSHPVTSALPYR
ncbi:MAG: UvrD-helicase domain-containing protein [Zavarzinella sp.]